MATHYQENRENVSFTGKLILRFISVKKKVYSALDKNRPLTPKSVPLCPLINFVGCIKVAVKVHNGSVDIV